MKKTLIGLATAGLLMLPLVGFAFEPDPSTGGLDKIEGANSGLAEGDLPTFLSGIISWVLGIIGVILVGLFVYGGVLYATSAGNEDRVETGKRVMIYAVIGTVIVFAAFIVSEFIISALVDSGDGI